MQIENKIQAILFVRGEPVSQKKLAEILEVGMDDVEVGIQKLQESLAGQGLVLQKIGKEVTLGTAPELSPLIEKMQKEELSKELSKASLETLSIILYKNGASRAEIDYIRGVNSTFTLRALSIRGLVERTVDPRDSRRYIYMPSFDLLSYMGLSSVEELPQWGEVATNLGSITEATLGEQDKL